MSIIENAFNGYNLFLHFMGRCSQIHKRLKKEIQSSEKEKKTAMSVTIFKVIYYLIFCCLSNFDCFFQLMNKINPK